MVSGKPVTDFLPVNSLTSSLVFGSVTSISELKCALFLRFSRKRQDGSAPIFFQDFGETLVHYNLH